jgi:hypothetical protein
MLRCLLKDSGHGQSLGGIAWVCRMEGEAAADLHPGVRAGCQRQCQPLRSLQDPAHAAAHDVPVLYTSPAMLAVTATFSACLPA